MSEASVPFLCSTPTESKGGVPGAAALTAAGRRQPPPSAGVYVPPPGVRHQHGLLQPLDWTPLELNFTDGSTGRTSSRTVLCWGVKVLGFLLPRILTTSFSFLRCLLIVFVNERLLLFQQLWPKKF